MFATSQSLVQTPPNPPGGGGGGGGGGGIGADGDTPRNPFSISVILSDEVGQKRSPPSNSVTPRSFSSTSATPLSRNERPRRPSAQGNTAERASSHSIGQLFHTPNRSTTHQSGGGTWGQRTVRPPRATVAEAANSTKSPSTNTGLLNGPGILLKGSSGSQQPRLTPSHPHSHNSSITASPFNANILQALGQQQMTTPTNKSEDILDDSLGMLSTVALLDSEMSDVNTSAGTSVQERLAGMKITSQQDASFSSHDEDRIVHLESSTAAAVGPSPSRKSHTPHILKRDRRRHRKQSLTDFSKLSGSSGSTAGEDHTHLNTGFLSPLAADHAHSKQQFTFSPSIFLSRPGDDSSNPSPQQSRPTSLHPPRQGGGNRSAPAISATNCPIGTLSPSSESDAGVGEEFVTSTPIKRDKENMHGAHKGAEGGGGVTGGGGGAWSPSILQTSGGTRRHFLRETNDASSGSDSEVPVKKLKTTPLAHPHQHKRRKSKARTKLSPLLENACSPIAKADHTHQPSPLVTSVTSTAPSQTLSPSPPPHTQAPSTSSAIIGQLRPVMTAESAQPQAPPLAPPTPSYSASSIPQLAASLVLSQGQHQPHQANALPHQSMATVYPMLQKSAALPNQTTLLSPQATLINPALGYPFNPIVPAFGSFVPMHSYATSPVCLPGFLPGISSFYNPQAHTTQPVAYPTNLSSSVNLMGNTSLVGPQHSKWGGSVCSSPHQASSGHQSHLQSVPPWFIFSDKRADSKRSRMTEAINKSLSETPSQKTKLPAEWSKYACGQTADQRVLTEEARSFLLRPRQLHFDEES